MTLSPLLPRSLAATAALVPLGMSLPAMADLDTVRFGVPPWPGVTVKSEVAAELLEAMGYQTRQSGLAVSVILNGVAQGDLEAYLGGWYPVEEDMVEPLVEQGKVVKAAANIDGAMSGLVVPDYVYDAGVHTVADLAAHRDQFDGEILGIEAGTGINNAVNAAIDGDLAGLGDWSLRESSTAAMLAQAGQKIENHEWVTFIGWEPHWMNISYDLRYLEDSDGAGVAGIESTVWTVLPADLEQRDPDVYRFFSQFVVDIEDQNQWVYAHSYQEKDADAVASQWIATHLDTVGRWLEGVEAKNGEPAIDAVRARFD
ncbi:MULTISPECIES: ABC transporter substrate-binding protein [unclassified Modicisalibacter]|uniref:ABC transporter substrate-binding protein n=1 Tax=unclassified Modicisalibacter TaxID=2679913 RepID=UPI001CCC6838|nr:MULTISPECIES: ABC transporter substrate-binding protein [unclassified Modicisalibacter]MBZ9557553.1 ABC transporter substrate-binding protein [Modicisalibacter sp. R2A 31.J]MBZ9573782.1 ABC transporter substrate-binding protein [Modicisalibacter sp. MOD 31.J]